MYSAANPMQQRHIRVDNAKNEKMYKRRYYKTIIKIIFILLFIIFAVFVFCSAKNIFKKEYDLSFGTKSNSKYLQLQNPELPNGCEATSLAMALTLSGIDCDKLTAYEAVPATNFIVLDNGSVIGANPEISYAGNAATESGFYCFAAPITEAANQILQQNSSSKTAVNITGAQLSELDRYLENDFPVIVWVTKSFESPAFCQNYFWRFNDSVEKYVPYSNLHCVVLNSVKNNVYEIFDPLSGVIYIEKDLFNQIYIEMGSRAVVIN